MKRPIAKLLEDHLPSFCWQSAYEVLIMLEQIDEDVGYDCVKTTLCRMSEGAVPRVEKVFTRIAHCIERKGPRLEYLYRFNPAFERAPSPRRGAASHAVVAALVGQSSPARPVLRVCNPATDFSLSPVPAHRFPKSAAVALVEA